MDDATAQPLDEIDHAILNELAAVHTQFDPPPADLDELVRFAIALPHVEAEVARLHKDLLVGSGARGSEQSRTITFDSASLTILVTVATKPDGRRRLDGWLAPAGSWRVEMRTAADRSGASTHIVTADESGRFVLDDVGPGLAQLVLLGVEPGMCVVTPSMIL